MDQSSHTSSSCKPYMTKGCGAGKGFERSTDSERNHKCIDCNGESNSNTYQSATNHESPCKEKTFGYCSAGAGFVHGGATENSQCDPCECGPGRAARAVPLPIPTPTPGTHTRARARTHTHRGASLCFVRRGGEPTQQHKAGPTPSAGKPPSPRVLASSCGVLGLSSFVLLSTKL